MKILVTGATGLLGNNIVRQAIDRRIEVVAVSRKATGSKSLANLDLQTRDIDLADYHSLDKTVAEPFQAIVHCAAHIHIGWTQSEEAMRINQLGTQHVLNLARDRGCRMVHVSTVNTLAVGKREEPADEETSTDGQVPCTYVVSKRAAEAESRKAIERGDNVVIVYPGFMLGPWDWKPSSGKMICELKNGCPPLAPSGGCSVCDPRDVADAVLNAIDIAPRGGRYVLAGENLTYFDLWTRIASVLGKRKPLTTMRLPAKVVAGTVGDLVGKLSGIEPAINSAAIAMASQFHWYSSQRAIDSIGYRPRPASESIQDAIDWLRQYGCLSSGKP